MLGLDLNRQAYIGLVPPIQAYKQGMHVWGGGVEREFCETKNSQLQHNTIQCIALNQLQRSRTLQKYFTFHTVRKEIKCSGDSEILHEKVRDTTCTRKSEKHEIIRVVSRTISCSISESRLHFIFVLSIQ